MPLVDPTQLRNELSATQEQIKRYRVGGAHHHLTKLAILCLSLYVRLITYAFCLAVCALGYMSLSPRQGPHLATSHYEVCDMQVVTNTPGGLGLDPVELPVEWYDPLRKKRRKSVRGAAVVRSKHMIVVHLTRAARGGQGGWFARQ